VTATHIHAHEVTAAEYQRSNQGGTERRVGLYFQLPLGELELSVA
jgi:hypothetical protein